jgi:hypothetical protein
VSTDSACPPTHPHTHTHTQVEDAAQKAAVDGGEACFPVPSLWREHLPDSPFEARALRAEGALAKIWDALVLAYEVVEKHKRKCTARLAAVYAGKAAPASTDDEGARLQRPCP